MADSSAGITSRQGKKKRKVKKERIEKRLKSPKRGNEDGEAISDKISESTLVLNEDADKIDGLQDGRVKPDKLLGHQSEELKKESDTIKINKRKRKMDEDVSPVPGKEDKKVTEILNNVESGQLKKVKKAKKKKDAKTEHVNDHFTRNTNNSVADDGSIHPAIDYLLLWKKNRSKWSFKKARQVWLLRNIYDDTKLCNKNFKILIKYLKDLKGKSKEETLVQAREMMEKPDEDGVLDSERALQRIRAEKILKLLS